uniref:Adenosylmethionine-8-amino-7-oxononanoate aminotransferase n=1 Tax=Candidatus Kentrum sp. FW TaxID=2126338 RepID=A0A450SFS9_9GAMM|nr:MAG: Adenosylmethionine-8-amino-7-oxononanoate aminotransferase [Candidatus Kentron sp. FW]
MKQSESHVFFTSWHQLYQTAERGEGVYLYNSDGKRYLDAIGGMFVVTIGHGIKEIGNAMAEQAGKLCFANRNVFTSQPQEHLANKIIEMSPSGMDRVFFVTSGSTANEIALQITRQYQIERGYPSKYKIIGQWHNYYGATIGALSMSGNLATRRRMNMEPYFLDFPHIQPPHCYQCPFRSSHPGCGLACANELATMIEQEGPASIAGFIATPIIGGTGGAIVPPPGYYERIREICDYYNILFIADEVITGFGRLGKNFGIEHWNTIPDIITTGKTLGSGYSSIGAVIVHERIWNAFMDSNKKGILLLSTYSGHPVSCAAALSVQNYITKHGLIERCAVIGRYLKNSLQDLAEREPLIGDVRGEGLFLGIEFVQDQETRRPFPRSMQLQEKITHAAFEHGLIVSGRFGTGAGIDGDHISISPPFIITEDECDELIGILEASIKQVKDFL